MDTFPSVLYSDIGIEDAFGAKIELLDDPPGSSCVSRL